MLPNKEWREYRTLVPPHPGGLFTLDDHSHSRSRGSNGAGITRAYHRDRMPDGGLVGIPVSPGCIEGSGWFDDTWFGLA